MRYIYFDKSKPIFAQHPELKLIDEFKPLNDHQMKYVIMMVDYSSPYFELRPTERAAYIADDLGWPKDEKGRRDSKYKYIIMGDDKEVNAASRKYSSLQYDEDMEDLIALKTLKTQMRSQISAEKTSNDDTKKAIDIAQELDSVTSLIKNKEKTMYKKEEDQSKETTIELSTLDEFLDD